MSQWSNASVASLLSTGSSVPESVFPANIPNPVGRVQPPRTLHRRGNLPNIAQETKRPWNDDETLEIYKTVLGSRLIKIGFPDIGKPTYPKLQAKIRALQDILAPTENSPQDYAKVDSMRGALEMELLDRNLYSLAFEVSQDSVLDDVYFQPTFDMNSFHGTRYHS